MSSHSGKTPLAENSDNNNGEVFFSQLKSLKTVLDRYVRQRNTLLATTVLLFLICIVLLVCFVVLKRRESSVSSVDGVCNSLGCIFNAAGRLCVTYVDL